MSKKKQRIDELMDKVGAAMARTAYFEAERLAAKALLMAREDADFDAMARIILPLQEARRLRTQQALDTGSVRLFDEPITDEMHIEPGCYLIQPPLVGADARKLRFAAMQREVPVAVVCREPKTKLGLWPIVAVGAGDTVRTRIKPPAKPASPAMSWFVGAMEAIGDEAIAGIDPAMEAVRRLDAALAKLDIIPEHEKLHQFIEKLCREAAAAEPTGKRPRVKS